MKEKDHSSTPYTCNEYREEMILVSLRRRLMVKELSEPERQRLMEEIEKIEKKMGLI